MEKKPSWTIAQKANAAPSIVKIDKQPQLKPRNEQLVLVFLIKKGLLNLSIFENKDEQLNKIKRIKDFVSNQSLIIFSVFRM